MPFRVCRSRVGASVCKACPACICTCLQWFLTRPCASSMWNLDSSLHRDTEDTVYYHVCVAFQMCKLLCQDVCTLMRSCWPCFWPQCTLAGQIFVCNFLVRYNCGETSNSCSTCTCRHCTSCLTLAGQKVYQMQVYNYPCHDYALPFVFCYRYLTPSMLVHAHITVFPFRSLSPSYNPSLSPGCAHHCHPWECISDNHLSRLLLLLTGFIVMHHTFCHLFLHVRRAHCGAATKRHEKCCIIDA